MNGRLSSCALSGYIFSTPNTDLPQDDWFPMYGKDLK